jgi:hypothetical protein
VRTFIVRLQDEAAGRPGDPAPRLCGVVDEVSTGMRAMFRSDQELVAALIAAVGPGRSDRGPAAPDTEPKEN